MKAAPLLAALLVTTQAGAWSQDLCVSKQGTDMFLRCQFSHNQLDWSNYRAIWYYCANKTVPGSYPDPLKWPTWPPYPIPNPYWHTHGGFYDPFVYWMHNTFHLWNEDLWIPCENQRDSWGSWTRRESRQFSNQFVFGKKDMTANISTIGANCANEP